MLKNIVGYAASLTEKLPSDARYLPLNKADEASLLNSLGDNGHTYLTIKDHVTAEVVKVTSTCAGFLVERGQDGSRPRTFPRGACVMWEMTPAVVKELICTHDCCDPGPCACVPVESAGITSPAARVGVPWSGSVVFTGDTPMGLSITGLPGWVTVTQHSNYLELTGTPPAPGEYTFAASAANCNGHTAVQFGKLIIS